MCSSVVSSCPSHLFFFPSHLPHQQHRITQTRTEYIRKEERENAMRGRERGTLLLLDGSAAEINIGPTSSSGERRGRIITHQRRPTFVVWFGCISSSSPPPSDNMTSGDSVSSGLLHLECFPSSRRRQDERRRREQRAVLLCRPALLLGCSMMRGRRLQRGCWGGEERREGAGGSSEVGTRRRAQRRLAARVS